jgi:hypothetical protein
MKFPVDVLLFGRNRVVVSDFPLGSSRMLGTGTNVSLIPAAHALGTFFLVVSQPEDGATLGLAEEDAGRNIVPITSILRCRHQGSGVRLFIGPEATIGIVFAEGGENNLGDLCGFREGESHRRRWLEA